MRNLLQLPDLSTLFWTLLGGVVGFALWEIYSGWINPLIFGFAFGPLPLIKGLLGVTNDGVAYAIHLVTGVVVYALGYTLVLRRLLPGPWLVPAVALGLATWVLALGILAPMTGAPFMLNFGTLTWGSLIGHVLLGLGVGAVTRYGPHLFNGTNAATAR